MELIESCNPLPNVTGRVCPQELQCQGVCTHQKRPIEIGQLEWYLPQREKMATGGAAAPVNHYPDPWTLAVKPPIAVVGSGPAGLINAYLLAAEGFPVTVFEAFHALGGVLRYGIPEFRLPNELINDVVDKITLLGGRFVSNFVVGKTATLDDLKHAGFWKIFVGTGAGLPRFMNVPGEHLLNVMSANEFLTRVNLMQGAKEGYETPLPHISGQRVMVIGGGNTAINAAGDGQAAAREIVGDMNLSPDEIRSMVSLAGRYSTLGAAPNTILAKMVLADGIVEFIVRAPLIAKAARAGQFVRVLPWASGELIPLTLADWDAVDGTVCLVVQGLGSSSMAINRMEVGEAFAGIAGPLGQPSLLHRYPGNKTVVFTAGGVGLPPVYPIMREHLRAGNHVTLIAGFRNAELRFWIRDDERTGKVQAGYPGLLAVIGTSNDGSFGRKGFVTGPLEDLLKVNRQGGGREITEVITIGPPLMMRAVCDLTRPYGVKTMASLNSIMVDATGMCGACMVPVNIDGRLVRKHACIDGPEIDGHLIDWDKFLPRFNQFNAQEQASKRRHGFA